MEKHSRLEGRKREIKKENPRAHVEVRGPARVVVRGERGEGPEEVPGNEHQGKNGRKKRGLWMYMKKENYEGKGRRSRYQRETTFRPERMIPGTEGDSPVT